MITSIASSSSGNAHIVDNQILLDCGVKLDALRKHLGNLTKLSGCLVSHSHQDHCSAVEDLLTAGIEVYMDKSTKDELKLNHHRLHVIEPINETYQVGDYKVKGFPLIHDSAGGTGFLLKGDGKKVTYIIDTEYCPYQFKGLTHLMIEINYAKDILKKNLREGRINYALKKRVMENHYSLEFAKKFLIQLDKSHLREIKILHLSSDNSDAERFKREIQEATGIPVKVPERRSK